MPDQAASPFNTVSPLVLSHHLLALAEDADRAGLRRSACRILELALTVCSDIAPAPGFAFEAALAESA